MSLSGRGINATTADCRSATEPTHNEHNHACPATVHTASDTKAFVETVLRSSPNTTILIDEAYHEYVANPGYATMIPLAIANPRVVVARTFSKVYGMAGLRIGYAIGQPATLKRMQAWVLGSGVNQLALAAAIATVGDTAHIADDVKKNAATKKAEVAALQQQLTERDATIAGLQAKVTEAQTAATSAITDPIPQGVIDDLTAADGDLQPAVAPAAQ